MFYKIGLRKENVISVIIIFFLIYLVFSCAQAPVKKEVAGIVDEKPAQIESIKIISDPSDEKTMIEITSSRLISYAAFKLVQPSRLIVDLNALPAQGLTSPGAINDRLIKDIRCEKVKDRPLSTRLIATLVQDAEYNVSEKGKTLKFLLFPKKTVEIVEKQPPSLPEKGEEIAAKEPRLFFSPSKTNLNQILGVDFYMLPKGKSRVTVTTTKRAEYDLSRKNSLTLLLEIMDASIPSELTRYLNSSLFKGAVNRITPIVKISEKQVGLEIELKEMVPYHVIQTDKEIRLNFSKTSVKPSAKKITQTRLGKAFIKTTDVPPEALVKPSEMLPHAIKATVSPFSKATKYTGARMTLEFSDADIRNILKLIGEVSKRNIVWGPEVKGTVSMRLKNVPWDQALDVVLDINNLGKREEGNIIRVMTKEKIRALEKENEDRRKAQEERRKEAIAAKKAAEAEEPLITEYLRVDFANAETEIKPHIENIKSERGTISVDTRTNTIIMSDIAKIIDKAKTLVNEFDTPVKQIMIEARIVDATTTFSRDLGVQWSNNTGAQRRKSGASFGIPTDATSFSSGGSHLYGGSFSTNAPSGWAGNIGLSFGTLSSSGMGALTLNASLALAETENKAKIISAPKVIASNGEEATISRGDIIYKEIISGDTTDVKELPATLELTVTPTVSFNNYVTMEINVKDDKVYTDQSGKAEKSIKTKLMVMSGDTVVIGGIYKEDKSEKETGIPGLSKIPILGWLFKAQTKSAERSELLIFLTPRVLPMVKKKM